VMPLYRIILHIGLHKTATTSLQYNVFYSLHNDGLINFLGVLRDDNGKEKYNVASRFLSPSMLDRRLTKRKLLKARHGLEKMLSPDKVNVFSDEMISSSLDFNVGNLLANLKVIFEDCDVVVLVSLRNQADMLLSRYVEHFVSCFSGNKKKDTFLKFVDHICNNVDSTEYIEFRYQDFLNLVSSNFEKVKVLVFEDLKFDKDGYFGVLGDVLGIKGDELCRLFYADVKNKSKETNGFKASGDLSVRGYLSSKLKSLGVNKSGFFYPLWQVWRVFSPALEKIVLSRQSLHGYPDEQVKEQVRSVLGIKDISSFSEKYNIDPDKLRRYQYGIQEKGM